MKKLFLNGCIFLGLHLQAQIPAMTEQVLHQDWEFKNTEETGWKKARVPGTVIGNLVQPDSLYPAHPYYGDMEKAYQWTEDKDWEFITRFYSKDSLLGAGQRCVLALDGVDLFAGIFLNGRLVLTTNNAFIPWETDITSSLKKDGTENELKIVFTSTLKKTRELADKNGTLLPGGERVFARKPAYEFGWDWGPRFVNMGIRKYIKLVYIPSPSARFGNMMISEKSRPGKDIQLDASIEIDAETETHACITYTSVVYGDDWIYNLPKKPLHIKKGKHTYHFPVKIKNVEKWWPNGYGDQHVYPLHFFITDSLGQYTWYEKSIPYAVCDIELVRKKDKAGETFYFTVNGQKVFAKGANYIPDDSFEPGKNTGPLIDMAAAAGFNMLRVWGGGTYPGDDFYDQCLQKGIMIWQDFMFACAMYPGDTAFKKNLYKEATYHVKKLVNYNNLALWCGNNENDEGWKNWGWQKEFKYSFADSSKIWNDYLSVFNTLLPAVVQQHDKNTAYIPSSPKYGWGRKQSMLMGDSHYWGVWWGKQPIDTLNVKVPRFMSEYGMQAMPDVSTLQPWIPDTGFYRGSSAFNNHQKHPTGFETLDHYLATELLIPDRVEDYAYATEIIQSLTLTTAIEAQRRAMPYCMGSLLWQLNDCWPVISWSIIDDQLHPKMGYDAVKRAYQPRLISVKKESDRYDVYIVNDDPAPIKDSLFLYIADFYGKKLWEKKISVNIRPASSSVYVSLPNDSLKNIDLSSVYFHIHTANKKQECFYYFKKLKDLSLPKAEIRVKENQDHYIVTSDVFAPYGILYRKNDRVFLPPLLPGEKVLVPLDKNYTGTPVVRCLNRLLNTP